MRLHELLRRERESILSSWERRVVAEPREVQVVGLALRDHLPAFLNELADWLESDAPPDSPRLHTQIRTHTLQRLEERLALGQLMREYRLLREAILQTVLLAETAEQERFDITDDPDRAWRVKELALLNAGLDAALGHSVEQFVAERDRRAARLEEEVRGSEERLRALVEPWAQAYWEADASGRIVADSPSWRAYTGQSHEEWLGAGWLEAVHPDDRGAAEHAWRDAVSAHRPLDAEFRLRRAGGGWRWTDFRASPLLEADGRVRKWVGINVDITARKEAEAAFRASELRLRLLVANAPVAVALLDREMRYLAVSRRYLADYGLTEDPLGRSHYEVFPEIPGRWRAIHRRCLRGEPARSEEDPFRRPDGSTRWLRWEIVPWRDAQGGVGGIALFTEDITSRRAADAALREHADRQSFLLKLTDTLRPLGDAADVQAAAATILADHLQADQAFYGLVEDGGEAVVVIRDHAAAGAPRLTGRIPVAAFGASAGVLAMGQTLVVRDVAADTARGGQPHAAPGDSGIGAAIVVPLLRRGRWVAVLAIQLGRPRDWTEQEVTRVEDTAERTWAAVERATAEEARRRVEEELRDADRRKTEFLGMLSHELRNPLTPIVNSLHLLERSPPDSERAVRARAILQRQTRHLVRLVDDLLDVTRISRGKIELQRAPLEFGELVRRATDDQRSVFEASGVELRVEVPSSPTWMHGDATRLAQVLGNLLQNGVKFTPSGGRVEVRLFTQDSTATLIVRDTGTGLPATELERIFEPFAQGAQDSARSKGGLGLGLSLCKGLVEMHGGAIHAASEGPGRGAEFVITLPLAPASAPRREPKAEGTVPRRDVLVVEDNVDAGDSLADTLAMSGHRVRVARDAGTGLRFARAERPDLVLCDIGLPDMDGYAFAREVRQDPALRSLRLVALTGYAQPEDRARAELAGFDAHLPKPPSLGQLETLLRGLPARAG